MEAAFRCLSPRAIFGVSLLIECHHLHQWTGVACDPDGNH
jgi:hypothetical protein